MNVSNRWIFRCGGERTLFGFAAGKIIDIMLGRHSRFPSVSRYERPTLSQIGRIDLING